MMKDVAEGGTVVLRALMSMIAFWVVIVVAAFFVGDALIRGRWSTGLRAAGVLLFVIWALWVFLYRMSIVVDRNAVTVRNLLRFTRIPWAQIADFDRRYQVRVILHDGTAVDCWGSPFPGRTAARRSSGSTPDTTLETLRALGGSAAPASTDPVTRGWDVPAVLIGVACAVCALIALLV